MIMWLRKDSAKSTEDPVAIVVLGTHRSGTSVFTKVISLLGAELPANVMAANSANEAGFWEPSRLVDLHDELLSEAGSHWADIEPLRLDRLPLDRYFFYRAEIARIIGEEYRQSPLIVIKDPRVCRFARVALNQVIFSA